MPEIPNVRDFPPIAKAEIAAETKPTASDDRGPMGLLKKLKSGFGIQDEVAEVEPASGADQSADQQATIEQATIEQATNEQASIDQPTSGQIANDQTNAPVNLSPAQYRWRKHVRLWPIMRYPKRQRSDSRQLKGKIRANPALTLQSVIIWIKMVESMPPRNRVTRKINWTFRHFYDANPTERYRRD